MDKTPTRHGKDLRTGRVSMPGQVYLITSCTAGRQRHFRDFSAACAAAATFMPLCQAREVQLIAWVLMPDHAHWVLQLPLGQSLSRLVQSLKVSSARAANQRLCRSGRLWQPGFHDHALRRDQDLRAVCRYVIANPRRAGLVDSVARYPFWDAIWLRGGSR